MILKRIADTFVIADVMTYRYGKVDKPKPHYHIPVVILKDLVRCIKFPSVETFITHKELPSIPLYEC